MKNVCTLTVVREYADQNAIPTDVVDAVTALTVKGIFKGNGEGNFAADDTLTMDQMSVILARACGADLSNVDLTLVHGEAAAWAAPSVAWLIQNGVYTYDADNAYLGFAVYGEEGLTGDLTALAQHLELDVDVPALVAGMGLEADANVTRGQLAVVLAQLLGL